MLGWVEIAALYGAAFGIRMWRMPRLLEAQFLERRALAGQASTLRLARGGDTPAYRLEAIVGPVTSALLAHGYTRLGDVVREREGRGIDAAMRVFVDGTGTRFAFAAIPKVVHDLDQFLGTKFRRWHRRLSRRLLGVPRAIVRSEDTR